MTKFIIKMVAIINVTIDWLGIDSLQLLVGDTNNPTLCTEIFRKVGNDCSTSQSGDTAIVNMEEQIKANLSVMERLKSYFPFEINEETDIACDGYDGVLLVNANENTLKSEKIWNKISTYLKIDLSLKNEIAVIPVPDIPAGRVVYASSGPLDVDYDDVRSLKETAVKAVHRALKSGIKRPLIVLQEHTDFQNAELVTLLGVLEALYVPIQIREHDPTKLGTIEILGIHITNKDKTQSIIEQAIILQAGLRIAKDIGEGDPERMAPPRVQEYVESVFADSSIKLDIIDNIDQIRKEYPLFEAVNRGALPIERHHGRIIYMEYNPPDVSKIEETLLFVGKGVTYDTGGADIKYGGVMAGMSRDKCGAAAVAGFMQVVNLLQPDNVRVIGALCLVRNSVGANCYVADELIKARSGALVRIGNTDAEGRMVMGDVLCKMKELALNAVNPHLFTVATLTGHAYMAVGSGYSIAMDNGPARKERTSLKLQKAGEIIGDPFEVSTMRREDLAFHRGKARGDDVHQSNNLPSSRTPRGHQAPAAFLLLASGLDKHGSGDEKPLKYSHLDIAGSAGDFPGPATGAPILALANAFLLTR